MLAGFQRSGNAFQPLPAFQMQEAGEGFQCTAFQLDAFQNICGTPAPAVVLRGGRSYHTRVRRGRRYADQIDTILENKRTGQTVAFAPDNPPAPTALTPFELEHAVPNRIYTSHAELLRVVAAEARTLRAQHATSDARRKRIIKEQALTILMLQALDEDDDD